MRNLTSLWGIEIVDFHSLPKEYHCVANLDWDQIGGGIVQCPYCGKSDPDLQGKGHKDRTIKDRPVGRYTVTIDLRCERYQCMEEGCGKSFGTTHPKIKPNSTLSIELVRLVTHWAERKMTQAQVAQLTGVASGTVRKCLKEHSDPPREIPEKPEAVGIDELHAGKGGAKTVITALEKNGNTEKYYVYNVLPNKKTSMVEGCLNCLKPAQRPLPVVTDMAREFRTAVQQSSLPAILIFDRFHLAQNANQALGSAKKDLIGEDMKDDWEDCKENIYNRAEGPDALQGRLKVGDDPLDKMAAVYKAILWYQYIISDDSLSREEANERLKEWNRAVQPPIRRHFESNAISKLEDWRDKILNYYDHPYTNGFNEGMNNYGKIIDRVGAGYSTDTLRTKLQHSQCSKIRHPPMGFHAPADNRRAGTSSRRSPPVPRTWRREMIVRLAVSWSKIRPWGVVGPVRRRTEPRFRPPRPRPPWRGARRRLP